MKEAIGGISIFQIVIFFIILFAAIMALTINHSKAFGVKDEVINIIENEKTLSLSNNYELSEDTRKKIADHLNTVGYRITGNCPDGWNGYDRNGQKVNKNAAFCVKANDVSADFQDDLEKKCKDNVCKVTRPDYPTMVYYEIILFYQLDVPIINSFTNFEIYGATKIVFGGKS